jgi:nucleoid-associated protein YgaU
MQDPFKDPNNKRFQREVQMWMGALVCLMAVFVYFAVRKISGADYTVPEHILRSGVAKTIRSGDPADAVASLHKSPNFGGAPNLDRDSSRHLHAPTIPPNKFGGSTFAIDKAKPNRQPFSKRPASSPTQIAPSPDERIGFKPIPPIKIQQKIPATEPVANMALAKSSPSHSKASNTNAFDAAKFENSIKFAADETDIGVLRLAKLAAMTQAIPERIAGLQESMDVAKANFARTDSKPNEAKPSVSKPLAQKSADPKPAIQFGSEKLTPAVSKAAFENQANEEPPTLPSPTEAKQPKNAFEPLKSFSPLMPGTIEPKLPKPDSETQVSTKSPHRTASQPLPPLRPEPDASIESVVSIDKLIPASKQPPVKNVIPTEPTTKIDRYTVVAEDGFFSIAQQHYGDGRYFEALYLANQDRVPSFDDLPAGVELEIPSVKSLRQRFPKSCASISDPAEVPSDAETRIYATRDGDTLFDIARRRLGQASRYVELIQNNEFRLPAEVGPSDTLPENLRLVLPR